MVIIAIPYNNELFQSFYSNLFKSGFDCYSDSIN